jgi:ABC-type amino acid transport substrate-binding protein
MRDARYSYKQSSLINYTLKTGNAMYSTNKKTKTAFVILFILELLIVKDSLIFASEILVYRNESMPWCGTVNDKDAGITVEILHEIEKQGGPVFKFSSLPWKRAQLYVKKNKGTAIIPLTRTAARENQYKWIVKLVANKVRLTMAKTPKMEVSRPVSISSLSSYLGLRVGIIRGSAIIPTCKKLGFKYLEEANTAEMNVKKLSFGRIDAMVESQMVDNYLWKKFGENEEHLIAGPAIGDAKYIYLAASLNFPENLTEKIRKAMIKVRKNGRLEKILNSWQ